MRSAMPGVDAVEARSSRAFPRHTHEQFGIGLILDGAQTSASGRGPVEAGPGDVITVNPGEVHDGAPVGDRGRWWRMIYVDPPALAEVHSHIGEGRSDPFEFQRPVLSDPSAASQLSHLFQSLAGEAAETALLREQLLLSLLARMLGISGDNVRTRAYPSAIAVAKSMIDDAPGSAVTLADLARVSSLSRFQVLRAFTSATGFTPHAYLLQRRLGLARRLIAGRMPLAQAAAEAGFADQSHMTRVFTSRYGFSPGVYAAAFRS